MENDDDPPYIIRGKLIARYRLVPVLTPLWFWAVE